MIDALPELPCAAVVEVFGREANAWSRSGGGRAGFQPAFWAPWEENLSVETVGDELKGLNLMAETESDDS